jgi:hypothetical protein
LIRARSLPYFDNDPVVSCLDPNHKEIMLLLFIGIINMGVQKLKIQ